VGLIVDSSEVITAERSGQTAYEMMDWLALRVGGEDLAMSVVMVLELAHGLARADSESRRAKRQRFLDDLLVGMPVQTVTVGPRSRRSGRPQRFPKTSFHGVPIPQVPDPAVIGAFFAPISWRE